MSVAKRKGRSVLNGLILQQSTTTPELSSDSEFAINPPLCQGCDFLGVVENTYGSCYNRKQATKPHGRAMTKKSLSALIKRNRVYWDFSSVALVREGEDGSLTPIKFKAIGQEAALRVARDLTLSEGDGTEALVGDVLTGGKGLTYVTKCLYDWDLEVPYNQKEFELFLSEIEKPEADKFVQDFLSSQNEAYRGSDKEQKMKSELPINRLPKSLPGHEEATDEKK